MAWMECSQMSSRLEFVQLAQAPDANISALCTAFGISRKTGYKWLQRHKAAGVDGLENRSRRPTNSPRQSNSEVETTIVELHRAYPCWGARKLKALLPNGFPDLHHTTIDSILRRNGCELVALTNPGKPALSRFEHEAPNVLWQMDFKGHFPLTDATARRCHPLTVLDDHSRFNICLIACSAESGEQVQTALTQAFRRYGLPQRITCDNGPPWGTTGRGTVSTLEAWMIRLGVRVGHSTPYHPQTQGKDERFHRTLQAELLRYASLRTLAHCQLEFDRWRHLYNCQRPHEALGMQVPAARYVPSPRTFPEVLPPVEYDTADIVRKVRGWGHIRYHNHDYFIGQAFKGLHVALRYTATDGLFDVYFCQHRLTQINLAASTRRTENV